MRKVHLVCVTEPFVLDLAFTLKRRGYEVIASGDGLTEEIIRKLHDKGCICYGDGWFPDNLVKDGQSVVVGSSVKKDNPELLRAKELGLLIQSVPEFVFQRTRSKTRVVVAGNRGKKSIISMIMYALGCQKVRFDYALTTEIGLLPDLVGLSYESHIALIEGGERIRLPYDKHGPLECYRPHIAVLTNLSWPTHADLVHPEEYLSVYKSFHASIEREGKLIYFGGDPAINHLVEEVRSDITAIPYEQHPVIEKEGQVFLQTRYGDYPVRITDRYFLINLNAARLVCRQLGIKDADFYKAMSEYSLSSRS